MELFAHIVFAGLLHTADHGFEILVGKLRLIHFLEERPAPPCFGRNAHLFGAKNALRMAINPRKHKPLIYLYYWL